MQTRFEDRHQFALACQVQSQPGQSESTMVLPKRATVTDMSISGCAIESSRLRLDTEDRVLVGIGDAQSIEAEVRWSRKGEACGLRFMRPLSPMQVEHIAMAKKSSAGRAAKRAINLLHMQSKLRVAC